MASVTLQQAANGIAGSGNYGSSLLQVTPSPKHLDGTKLGSGQGGHGLSGGLRMPHLAGRANGFPVLLRVRVSYSPLSRPASAPPMLRSQRFGVFFFWVCSRRERQAEHIQAPFAKRRLRQGRRGVMACGRPNTEAPSLATIIDGLQRRRNILDFHENV